jgi:hypothetical protein
MVSRKSKPKSMVLGTPAKVSVAKKTRTEAEYEELRQMTVALAKCAVLTLDSKGRIGQGSGMTLNRKTGVVSRWELQFFDALDAVGIKYDRDKYFEKR